MICGIEKSRQRKIGGAEGGAEGGRWCENNSRRKLARSRLKWTGHVERTEGELLAKKADALKMEGRIKEKKKTETGGPSKEIFGGIGWGVENGSEGCGECRLAVKTAVKMDQ